MHRKERGRPKTFDERRGRRSRRQSIPDARAPKFPPGAFFLTIGLIAVAGAIVRILAARGELWLDEIWSYRVAHLVDFAGVFTGIHSDNNHYLNTLYLQWVPEGTATWLVYRLPSLIAGTASILLAAAIAREAGDRAAVAAAVCTAGSFLLVVYSSEARGYALAVACAFGCALLVRRHLEEPRARVAAAIGVLAALGLLAHLTFLHAFAGLATWTAVRAHRTGGWRGALHTLARLYALPVAVLAVLYGLDLRHLELGGGPPRTSWTIAANALALSAGAPDTGILHWTAVVLASLAAVASIVTVRRTGSDIWILFLVTVLVAPAVALTLVETNVIYERYLLVAAAFMLLSFGWLFEALSRRSLVAGVLAVAVLLAGNAARTVRFITTGRGSFVPALTHAVQHAVQTPVTIGSDHDFRIGRVVDFYRGFVAGGESIDYLEQQAWPVVGPEWVIRHRVEPEFHAETVITVLNGARYRLVSTYPYAGVSGWHMALYHNVLATDR